MAAALNLVTSIRGKRLKKTTGEIPILRKSRVLSRGKAPVRRGTEVKGQGLLTLPPGRGLALQILPPGGGLALQGRGLLLEKFRQGEKSRSILLRDRLLLLMETDIRLQNITEVAGISTHEATTSIGLHFQGITRGDHILLGTK